MFNRALHVCATQGNAKPEMEHGSRMFSSWPGTGQQSAISRHLLELRPSPKFDSSRRKTPSMPTIAVQTLGMRIRRATRGDIPDITCLLLKACADDPLHRLLEPRQGEYPGHTFASVRRGVRNKLLSDRYEVDVAVDDNGNVVGLAAWNCGAVRGSGLSWSSWGQLSVAAAFDRVADLIFGTSQSADLGVLQLIGDASDAMIERYASEKSLIRMLICLHAC